MAQEKSVIFIRKNGRVIPIKVKNGELAEAQGRVNRASVKGAKVGVAVGAAGGAMFAYKNILTPYGRDTFKSEIKSAFSTFKNSVKPSHLQLLGAKKPSMLSKVSSGISRASKSFTPATAKVLGFKGGAALVGAMYGGVIGASVASISAVSKEKNNFLKKYGKNK